MQARRLGSAWEVFAPAKLNLYLEILGKRCDGFHEIETVMAPVRLYDHLRWSPLPRKDQFEFHCRRACRQTVAPAAVAPSDSANLAVKAAMLLAHEAGVQPHGKLELLKRIPAEAGMGGGSSDAAAALALLNDAWGVGFGKPRLLQLAAEMGSDAPFFLVDGFSVCRGRGERVQALPGMPRLNAVAVKPALGVPTSLAFAELAAPPVSRQARADSSRRVKDLVAILRGGDLGRTVGLICNRLQSSAVRLIPVIERIEHAFRAAACQVHAMTGSGSAYYGLFASARQALRFARAMSAQRLGAVYVVPTCR